MEKGDFSFQVFSAVKNENKTKKLVHGFVVVSMLSLFLGVENGVCVAFFTDTQSKCVHLSVCSY